MTPVSAEARAYHADLAAAADAVLAKYDLDDFSESTPSIDAEYMALVDEVKRKHGIPTA